MPGDGSTRCAFGSGRPRPLIYSSYYCHPLLLSLLGTFNKQPGTGRRTALFTLSSLDSRNTAGCPISVRPVLGRMGTEMLGRQPCSLDRLLWATSGLWGRQGHGMVPGTGPCLGRRFGKRGIAVLTRQHVASKQPSCCTRGGGQSGHVVMGRPALPGADAAALPSCSGCVPRLAGAGTGKGGPGWVSAPGLADWQCQGDRVPHGALGYAPCSWTGALPEKWV